MTINANAQQRNSSYTDTSWPYVKRCEEEFSYAERGEYRSGGSERRWPTIAGARTGEQLMGKDQDFIGDRGAKEEEKDSKREKKWSLGAFFRRKRTKKEEEDSSEDCDDDERKRGFLSKRKPRRERRKPRSNAVTNGFDIVIPIGKEQNSPRDLARKVVAVGPLWEGGNTSLESGTAGSRTGSTRFIHRHRGQVTDGRDFSRRNNEVLEVLRQQGRDSGHYRNSDTFDGRKNRKEVMARAEAIRDLIYEESTSEESDHSNSSLNKASGDGIGCRRSRRSKRSSRTDEGYLPFESRIVKSDMERSRRRYLYGSETIGTSYIDGNDGEATRSGSRNCLATSSPSRSPRARQKELFDNYDQNAYSMRTFPPVVYHFPLNRRFPSTQSCRRSFQGGELERPESHWSINCAMESRSAQPTSVRALYDSGRLQNGGCRTSTNEFSRGKSSSFDEDMNKLPSSPKKTFKASPLVQKPFDDVHVIDSEEISSRCSAFRPQNQLEVRKSYTNDATKSEILLGGKDGIGSSQVMAESFTRLGIPHLFPSSIAERSSSGNSFFKNSLVFRPNRSTSYQHIPTYLEPDGRNVLLDSSLLTHHSERTNEPQTDDSLKVTLKDIVHMRTPALQDSTPERRLILDDAVDSVTSGLRYYADQNPRSRNPIQITCNLDHPYLSDSQIPSKNLHNGFIRHIKRNSSDFWRAKDKQLILKRQDSDGEKGKLTVWQGKTTSLRPQIPNSLHPEGSPPTNPVKPPPEPPIRRLSKQEVLQRLHKCEALKNLHNKNDSNNNTCHQNAIRDHANNTNLDDALNELEIIYNSLRLKDEDLVDRAERRDFPPCLTLSKPLGTSASCPSTDTLSSDNHSITPRQKALPLRRSAVPDRVSDDMAFRRMKPNERTDSAKTFTPQSYLRSSPLLFPIAGGSPIPRTNSPINEPDVTHDDVVFRNIRHANNMLKVQDPQPPFGIPIGVISSAANSDYLHVTPKDRFRPTFTSARTPDVVKDDLAFRNLRKDTRPNNPSFDARTDCAYFPKKKAIRSLSANIQNLMQRQNDHSPLPACTLLNKPTEKAQSLTDLTQERLETKHQSKGAKLNDLNYKTNNPEFIQSFNSSVRGCTWTTRQPSEENTQDSSRWKGHLHFADTVSEKKSITCPVVKLSTYPAAAPFSTEPENPFKDPAASSVDEDQLEIVLSTLAAEALHASKDLAKRLDDLHKSNHSAKCGINPISPIQKHPPLQISPTFNAAHGPPENTNRPDHATPTGRLTPNQLKPIQNAPEADGPSFCSTHTPGDLQKTPPYFAPHDTDDRPAPVPETTPPIPTDTDPVPRKHQQPNLATPDASNSHILHEPQQVTNRNVPVDPHLKCQIPTPCTDNDLFHQVYDYNCTLQNGDPTKNGNGHQTIFTKTELSLESQRLGAPAPLGPNVELQFEKLHHHMRPPRWTQHSVLSHEATRPRHSSSATDVTERDTGNEPTQPSAKGEGELNKPSVKSHVWLACSYALAFAFHLQEIDFLTALGIVLAVVSVVAILIL